MQIQEANLLWWPGQDIDNKSYGNHTYSHVRWNSGCKGKL